MHRRRSAARRSVVVFTFALFFLRLLYLPRTALPLVEWLSPHPPRLPRTFSCISHCRLCLLTCPHRSASCFAVQDKC